MMYSFGVFVLPLSEDFGVGRGSISWIGSLAAGFNLLWATAAGFLSDRYGTRPVVFCGGIALGVSLLISSAMPYYWLLYISNGIILGVGMSSSFVPAAGTTIQWFSKYRGLAVGIAVSGSGVGNFALPPIATAVIKSHGWRAAFRVLSAFSVLVLLASLVLKQRIETHRKWDIKNEVKSKPFILLFSSGFFVGIGYLIPFVHISAYAQDRGIDSSKASLLLSIIGIASTVGRILVGIFADRFGRLFALQITYVVMSLACLVWIWLEEYVGLAIFSFVFGFVGGGFISTLPTVAAEYFGIQKVGSIIGPLYSSAAIGNTVGPPIAGIIFDKTGSYLGGCVIAAVSCGIGFFITLFMPKLHTFKEVELP
eukprot:TRINITY_DN13932_c0_g1_i1.p1 TRINITY_DN13932_c0_g1~~TRINITY_DN13932_c0_g1_i1.p1  ORF type:complete len:367 (-),score=29.52 TRINITY_DN13932_c0_g1_i1:16-1116(-)